MREVYEFTGEEADYLIVILAVKKGYKLRLKSMYAEQGDVEKVVKQVKDIEMIDVLLSELRGEREHYGEYGEWGTER